MSSQHVILPLSSALSRPAHLEDCVAQYKSVMDTLEVVK